MQYLYEGEKPDAASQIGQDRYTYDANGNPVLVASDTTYREMVWNEENRLMILSDADYVSRYTYDYTGNRVIKSHGPMTTIYINGVLQGVDMHDDENYTLYVSPYMTVNAERFTKYYYAGTQRIASKLGSGKFDNVYGVNGFHLTAGGKDYAERSVQMVKGVQDYYRQAGVTPGVPNEQGQHANPYISGVAYPSVPLGDYSVPKGWPGPVARRQPGQVFGPPVSFLREAPQEAKAGVGFKPDYQREGNLFYFHTDHLGSTSYLTDTVGNVSQFVWYAPYGEALVDEHTTTYENPFKFSGKELDDITGLYDHGARNRNPITAVWYGIDELFEKYPENGPYGYCGGNPVRFVDMDGREAWVVVWATQSSDASGIRRIGHTGIVVENFNSSYESMGTYTYYDLWPSCANLGGKAAVQDVDAVYNSQSFCIITNGVKNTDYAALERYISKHDISQIPGIIQYNIRENEIEGYGEGYAPDGIIRLGLNGQQTYKLQQEYISLIQKNCKYNGESNNCTTFVANGINNSGVGNVKEESIIDWRGLFVNMTPFHSSFTPNNTYNQLKNSRNSVVIKNAGNKTRESYEDAIIDR